MTDKSQLDEVFGAVPDTAKQVFVKLLLCPEDVRVRSRIWGTGKALRICLIHSESLCFQLLYVFIRQVSQQTAMVTIGTAGKCTYDVLFFKPVFNFVDGARGDIP